ncbi:ankyrin repeat protein [Trichoderma harzianum]|uniref:Ankyrin repeat protein n=1 Tax=Trichoderma harzianum TaxID=5544 RepID=A0A0F9X9W3_TRIHA|nr:ankyrin repeat protein [Trichoderma harzianum]
MAEAIGIASGVAGLISLGLTIDLTLQQGQFSHDIIVAVETSLKLCKEALETLAKKLDKIRSTRADGSLKTRLENAKRRMLYPFKESTLAKLREICHDLKDNLGLAINVLDVERNDAHICLVNAFNNEFPEQTPRESLNKDVGFIHGRNPMVHSRYWKDDKYENTRPSIADIGSLLQNIVFSFSKVFIIIDALDECAEVDDVRFITLTELKKLQHRMLLLVMSRPMPDPEGLLEDAIRINVEASLTDIRNYIEQRIDNTRSMQKHVEGVPELRHRIVTVILQKIKGMFLMARLYLDTLTLPEGLDSIYDELMIRIKLQNPKDHAELAMKVIGWIFYAARPLTVTEMQHALAIEQDDTYLDEDGIPNPDLLVSVCAGLVMINDNSNTISFVHYTTQEYFNRGGKRLLGSANGDIASTCLTYLRFDSFSRRIENLTNRDVLLALLHEYPLLSYAAQHWGNHQRNAENERNDGQALELLRDENRVHTIAWLRDYANSLAKGTYFRPRAQVLGLALASSFGLTKVALSLIESNSSVNETDSIGQTALHRASENGHAETAELLLKMGAQINSKDLAGWTPLHQASSGADEIMAKLLIKRGADVNVVDGYNATPLYRAAEVGAEEITGLLLDNGANILVRNTYLQTALHRAVDRGHLPVVNLLLQCGADAGAKDHYGYTPFYRAADQGYENIAKLLRTHMLAR